MEIKGTHFVQEKIMDANCLDPASYKLLEPKHYDRHMKAFLR